MMLPALKTALMAALLYTILLACSAGVAMIVIWLLVGPHTGVLPPRWNTAVVFTGWLCVAVVPVLLTARIMRTILRGAARAAVHHPAGRRR